MRVIQFIAPAASVPRGEILFSPDSTPLVFDDRDRPVGALKSLLLEPRGSRPESEARSLLGVAHLHDGPDGDRAWRAIRTGGVTGIRLDIGDLRTPDGKLVRGRALHSVRLVPLDDAPDLRVVDFWEQKAASCS